MTARLDHPEDFCQQCGGRNVPSWSVDSDRWNQATAGTELRDVILCPGCFVALHEQATGMRASWMLVPNPAIGFRHRPPSISYSDWVRKTTEADQ